MSDPQEDALARLRAAAPGWTIWLGLHTRTWWACPPPGHPRHRLVSAATAEDLAEKIAAAGQSGGTGPTPPCG